ARYGTHGDRREGDRARQEGSRDRHGRGPPQGDPAHGDGEGDGQALRAGRVPRAAPRRPRDHHAQAVRQDRRHRGAEGGAAGRRGGRGAVQARLPEIGSEASRQEEEEEALGVVTAQDVHDAAERLRGVAVRTPLRYVEPLDAYLKLENLQPMGAFKIRGAYNAISRLPPAARRQGVITYSSGNHGQAVAYAAQLLGIRAVVVMPETAPAVKVAGVQKWGGE